MRFLPIVGRELRVAARRRGTYWLRSWVALIVILVSGWIFLFNLRDSPRELARTLFFTLTGGALFFCLVAGLRSTADCISEEKREGTLGLLFLTDLKGYDVVLGKLVANSLNGFYGLLAIVPVMAIPLLLGGVAPSEFARISVVLLNALFFSMCVGVFASACSRSARKSIGLTLLLVLAFAAGFPVLGWWYAWKFQLRSLEIALFFPSAGYAYMMAQDYFFKLGPRGFYWSLGTVHALGWVFLGLACLIAPRSWQDRPASARGVRWRALWQFWSYGSAAERVSFRTRLLNQNPFFWLAARARLKPAWVWALLASLACGWLWGWMKYRRDWLNEGIYVSTGFLLNSILKNWLASEAVRQLSDDRRMGTLELLLSTPLRVKEILRGQALALRRQFLGPLVVVLLVELLMMLASTTQNMVGSDRPLWISLWVAGMATLVADLVALYWVGMWLGLASRHPKRAFSDTVARVLAVPWAGFAVFMTLVALSSMNGRSDVGWKTTLGVWFLLGLLTDLGFGLWARHKLLTEFREMATRRYEVRASWWQRLFSGRAKTGAS